MKRRVVTVMLVVLGVVGTASEAQALGANMAGGYWGCVGTRHLDLGVCLESPLPEELPLPER